MFEAKSFIINTAFVFTYHSCRGIRKHLRTRFHDNQNNLGYNKTPNYPFAVGYIDRAGSS